WYDAIEFESTWPRAFLHARRQSHQDLPGHLATLTSQEENDFVWQTFQPIRYWLGGYQVRWARKVDRGWRWITGERWLFTNWEIYQPDDGGDMVENREENFLQFHGTQQWNDYFNQAVSPGYIIEYEEMPEQALLSPIKPKDIHKLTTTWANLKQAR
ncbi:hypothetical protein H8E77_31120, partial [bacterium]|nr:hypothetical protein [bacterium]